MQIRPGDCEMCVVRVLVFQIYTAYIAHISRFFFFISSRSSSLLLSDSKLSDMFVCVCVCVCAYIFGSGVVDVRAMISSNHRLPSPPTTTTSKS